MGLDVHPEGIRALERCQKFSHWLALDKCLRWRITRNRVFIMDRLTQMATFVKTVELGSFSAAADDLNLSP